MQIQKLRKKIFIFQFYLAGLSLCLYTGWLFDALIAKLVRLNWLLPSISIKISQFNLPLILTALVFILFIFYAKAILSWLEKRSNLYQLGGFEAFIYLVALLSFIYHYFSDLNSLLINLDFDSLFLGLLKGILLGPFYFEYFLHVEFTRLVRLFILSLICINILYISLAFTSPLGYYLTRLFYLSLLIELCKLVFTLAR